MKSAHLKKIRVIISIISVVLMLAVFLDIKYLINTVFSNVLLKFQFVPALFGIFTQISIFFLFLIVLTFLFGRIFCSFLCPLGTLQDIIIRISKKVYKRKQKLFIKNYKILPYSILVLVIVCFASGVSLPVIITEPYSIFGKITSNLFRPVIIFANNILSETLEMFDNYSLYPISIKNTSWLSVSISFALLITVLLFSFFRQRKYCNTICPAGTILGIFSKFSLFKLKIIESKCTVCKKCEVNCKANCINSAEKTIDFESCVACYNCIPACNNNGITFKFSPKPDFSFKIKKHKVDKTSIVETKTELNSVDRRKFIGSVLAFTVGCSTMAWGQPQTKVIIPKKLTVIPVLRRRTAMPPGAENANRFFQLCTACHLCVSQCPSQVLQPSFLQYGFFNMMQPFMDYESSYCNWKCTRCSEVCPTGAIQAITEETKIRLQIGKVVFIKDNCVVVTEGTDCGACSEHCPTKAVKMVPYKGSIKIPEIDQSICIGCGACEHACPTRPYRAIYVDGNAIQMLALKPKDDAQENVSTDDFPF